VQNDPVNFVDPSGLRWIGEQTCSSVNGGDIHCTYWGSFWVPDPPPASTDDLDRPPHGGNATGDHGTAQNPTQTPNPDCIQNAVAGSIGTSRGIIEAVGPNGPTGRAGHDGDHTLSGPGGPAAVKTLGPLSGTVIRIGDQGDDLHYIDVRLDSSIGGVAYNVRYKDLLTVDVTLREHLDARGPFGTYIGEVRPRGNPRDEVGLHTTLVRRSVYADYVRNVMNNQYSPLNFFMSAVSDPRSPVRCP